MFLKEWDQDSHHAFKYPKKEKKKNKEKNIFTSTIKTKNGKIAFFGQGQPVHFDYLFFLLSHVISVPPPNTLALL